MYDLHYIVLLIMLKYYGPIVSVLLELPPVCAISESSLPQEMRHWQLLGGDIKNDLMRGFVVSSGHCSTCSDCSKRL